MSEQEKTNTQQANLLPKAEQQVNQETFRVADKLKQLSDKIAKHKEEIQKISKF